MRLGTRNVRVISVGGDQHRTTTIPALRYVTALVQLIARYKDDASLCDIRLCQEPRDNFRRSFVVGERDALQDDENDAVDECEEEEESGESG